MAGHVVFDSNRCKGCELCINACLKKILALDAAQNIKGYRPACCVDESQCIGCASCARICPDSVISVYVD